jgi:Fur family transcriptional regulator, ferric uptake regulator
MSGTDGALEELLRRHGHRVTDPRRAVWEVLHQAAEAAHLTVDEVTARARGRGFAVDRASVYRALDLFEQLGVARSSQLGTPGGSRWERAHPDEHFHLRCTVCGDVDHHVGDLVARVREHLDDGHGFVVSAVTLSVEGTCGRCRADRQEDVDPRDPPPRAHHAGHAGHADHISGG